MENDWEEKMNVAWLKLKGRLKVDVGEVPALELTFRRIFLDGYVSGWEDGHGRATDTALKAIGATR